MQVKEELKPERLDTEYDSRLYLNAEDSAQKHPSTNKAQTIELN